MVDRKVQFTRDWLKQSGFLVDTCDHSVVVRIILCLAVELDLSGGPEGGRAGTGRAGAEHVGRGRDQFWPNHIDCRRFSFSATYDQSMVLDLDCSAGVSVAELRMALGSGNIVAVLFPILV